jgi:Rod binding domain-containing protein
MDILPLQPGIQASQLPLEQLARNPNVSAKDKVTEACRQFEAVLLRQILSEARKTVIPADSQQDPVVSGIYDDMVNNQLADDISRSGTFGLAKSLQAQLVRQVLPDANAADSSPKVKP